MPPIAPDLAAELDSLPLPPFTRELVGLLGELAAMALCARWPAVRLYVPFEGELRREEKGVHPIVACIGMDAALKLARAYGGQVITVPAGREVLMARRNARWVARFYRGESARTIALAEGLSQRRVEQVLAQEGAVADNRNLTLFD